MSDSTEMAIFNQPLPDYLRGAELDDTTKALMGGGGGSGKRISIKGGVWRMIVDGKEVAKNEDRHMNVIIVAAAPKVARTYYQGTYTDDAKLAPACWSADGEHPDASVKNPQAKSCATCPQNIKGSGKDESRACRFSQRLAVVLENDVGGDVYQLTLPATSIFGAGEAGKWPLKTYATMVGGTGTPITSIVTEMRFDTDSAVPKIFFRPVKRLSKSEYERAVTQGKSPEAIRAITMTVAQTDGVASKPKAVTEIKARVAEIKEPSLDEPVKREAKKQEEAPAPKQKLSEVLDAWDDE